MKKNIFLALLASLTFVWSCDKIESNNGFYDEFAGVYVENEEGTPVADKSQRAFLEKYTGVRCVNCPTADEAIAAQMAAYGDRLVSISIHDSGAFTRPFDGNPDFRTDDGNTLSVFYGVAAGGSYPTSIINRSLVGSTPELIDPTQGANISAKVDAILAQTPKVAIEVASSTSNGTTKITTNIEFLQDVDNELTLTLLIIEDNITATQMMPDGTKDNNYVHGHVLRDVITDVWGTVIDSDRRAGTCNKTSVRYTVSPAWVNANCKIVAFISDAATREVLNVAECHLH